MPWTLSRCCFFLCSHYYLIFSIGGSHSGAMEEPARRLFHTTPSTVTSALGSPLITTPTLPGPLSCIADDPRESSCVLQRREKKKIHILIYMFSQLIIYFPPAVSLGQIFHSILSRIPSGISHMLLQIMLSLFWCQTAEWWETLIKVQAGFTSFLNPFRTFLNISFAALSQDLGACHKSWPKNKNLKKRESMPPLLQIIVTFQTQSLDGLGTSQNHILWGNNHKEVFVLYCVTWQVALTLLLKYLWDGMWPQIWHQESGLLLWLPAMPWCQERLSSDQLGLGTCLHSPHRKWTDATWEIHFAGELTWTGDFYFPHPETGGLVL